MEQVCEFGAIRSSASSRWSTQSAVGSSAAPPDWPREQPFFEIKVIFAAFAPLFSLHCVFFKFNLHFFQLLAFKILLELIFRLTEHENRLALAQKRDEIQSGRITRQKSQIEANSTNVNNYENVTLEKKNKIRNSCQNSGRKLKSQYIRLIVLSSVLSCSFFFFQLDRF